MRLSAFQLISVRRHLSALTTLHTNGVSSISDFTTIPHAPSDEIVSHSIADRTKTRQRTQATKKLPIVQGDIIELTSEDDVVEKGTRSSAQSIKPKPKVKAKVKAKMVDKPLLEASNSHNDSIGSEQPRPRVRPRPKPIVKRAQPMLDSLHQYPFARDSFAYDIPAIPLPPMLTPASYCRQPDLPIATSSATINHTMGPGMTSQLPPSDPPNLTNTAGIGEKPSRPEDDTLPPIEILQDGESERDGDSRFLSPSSLFSDKGSRTKAKKRKRGVALDIQDKEHEVDQLIPSSPHRREPSPHIAFLDAYTHGPEPPPTFFAGSSSSFVQNNGERDSSPLPNPQADVIDLTDLPPTMKPSKPKKSKKKMINTEVIPTEEPRGDKGDSDFKPSGKKAVKKRKGNGKDPVILQKENMPKEKKERARKKKEQLDGVVLLANKTKTKGRPIEKEVFKSREFIDDSDNDTDPLLLVGGMQVDHGMLLPSITDGRSSTRVPDLNQVSLSSASDKSSRSKVDEPNSCAAAAAAVPKEKAKSKGKKRKSIVESDEEGSEKGKEIQDKDCIVVKKRKPASGAPVSDEVEQELVDKKKISQESVRSGKNKPEVPETPGPVGANQDKTMQMKDSNVRQRTSTQKPGIVGAFCTPDVRIIYILRRRIFHQVLQPFLLQGL